MCRNHSNFAQYLCISVSLWLVVPALGEEVKLLTKAHDPYGYPRPAPEQENVPLRTSFYIQLGLSEKGNDVVLPESVSLELSAEGVPAISLLRPGKEFASGVTGKFIPGKKDKL